MAATQPACKWFWVSPRPSPGSLRGPSIACLGGMAWIITKYLVTAAVVVLVSEVAKRSDRVGALIAALPMVTVLVLIWMKIEGVAQEKISNHAWYTFWYVVPTLPMFLAFPWLLPRLGFWMTLAACVGVTLVSFVLFALLVRRFGVTLM